MSEYTRPKGIMGGPCSHCGISQPEHVGLSCDEARDKRRASLRAVSERSSSEATLNTVKDCLQCMIASAEVYTDADDVVVAYKIKTGGLHKLIGFLGLTVPVNLPAAALDSKGERPFEAPTDEYRGCMKDLTKPLTKATDNYIINYEEQLKNIDGCPCVNGSPCSDKCTCINLHSSFGCLYCAKYGSKEQRTDRAKQIANKLQSSNQELKTNVINNCLECDGEGQWFDASHSANRVCKTCKGTGKIHHANK